MNPPEPGLSLALTHRRGYGNVAELVEAPRHQPGQLGANVQRPVAVVSHQSDVPQLVLDGGPEGVCVEDARIRDGGSQLEQDRESLQVTAL